MTLRHREPHQDWGLEPCEDYLSSTSSWASSGGRARTRGLRTRCGTGAASMGSTVAVHRSRYCGVALMRLPWRKDHVELTKKETSSAASSPQTSSALAGLRASLFRSVCDLPYRANSNVRLGSNSFLHGPGLIMGTGAILDLRVWGVVRALFRCAGLGALGTDKGLASGDPIRATS